jgi:anthraniloyl-CoA monooxygenase
VKIVCIGGGPAGLFFSILVRKARPGWSVTVVERNRADDTFGFGVVFSDQTLGTLGQADAQTFAAIESAFAHWDDIDIHIKGEVIRSTGHGFCGMSRQKLLGILQRRAAELGAELLFTREVPGAASFPDADLIVVADGVNSAVRTHHAATFQPDISLRPNRFVWLGTTFPFEAFTFYFEQNDAGLFQVHAYRYAPDSSTFIVECSEETFQRSGLDPADEDATIAYCERLFARQLAGHRLIKNRSLWRNFPVVRCGRWHDGRMVLVGDAAHTAHFSIGSGTKLAMEDAIALADAVLGKGAASSVDVPTALAAYEAERRPVVESFQRAAQVSLEWFESTERYLHLDPLTFAVSCLTRSLRVTHDNLKLRDPELVRRIDTRFAEAAAAQSGVALPRGGEPPPPMFTPFRLREMVVPNRVVVSPMCQYSADDGTVGDWHLVHLGSRAVGGAGLIVTEMTDVSREGRITPGCAGMYKREHVTAWKRIVDFVHGSSGARIALQLAHAGRKGSTRRMWEGIDQPLEDGNWPIVSASALPYFPHSQVPRELDRGDMDSIRADFVRAAAMAEEAGFDMIELHFAHGYLLASFISPLTNKRTDAYGGSLDNRLRWPLEVLASVRASWPQQKPLGVRISASDWHVDGVQPEEAVEIARRLAAAGCDIVDVSSGQTVPEGKPVYGRLYQTPMADRIRLEAGVPTMTVGNLTSWADVNSILAAGRADLCLLARGHLYDPYWTRHAAHEQGVDLPWPDQYQPAKTFTPRSR